MENVDFSQLLRNALNEPGKLMQAYSVFHDYSLGNALLASFQCYARSIAIGPINTYNGWRKLGRQVRRGERALSLVMPVMCMKRNSTEDDESGDGEVFTRFIFRANWFVLSQTDGADFQAESIAGWDDSLALQTLNINRVRFDHVDGNTQGYATKRDVAISPIAAYPTKTLLHEVAHVVLGHTAEIRMLDFDRTPKNLMEVEAESVAYLCMASLGMDGLEYARGYIQHWLGSETIPEKSTQKIFKVASEILKAGRERTEN